MTAPTTASAPVTVTICSSAVAVTTRSMGAPGRNTASYADHSAAVTVNLTDPGDRRRGR